MDGSRGILRSWLRLGHRRLVSGDFDRPRMVSRHLRPTGTVMTDICLGGRTRQYPLNPCTARQPGNAQTFFWRNFYMLAWDSAPGLSTARRYRDRRSMAMSLGSSVLQWKLARVARVGSEKSSLRPLIDVEIFLSKTYPSLLVYDVCGAGHSQMLLRYARPLRAVGASCRPAGLISMDLTKSILPARGAHPACG